MQDGRKKRHRSRDGKTEAYTLRLEIALGELCAKIAARANLMDLKRGGTGGVTAQDVMRHQIKKLERRYPKRLAEIQACLAALGK